MLLAEGWNSPRATVVMHLAPTASKRVYQQRIGRIMRTHPRKEAGIVVDFVPKAATHNERVVSLHSLLDADFYREGARVTPAPRRRQQRRARRKLTPAQWLVPVTPDVSRRIEVIRREWQRIDPKYLDEEEQEIWATVAARNMRFDERTEMVKKFTERGASKRALAQFLKICAGENPNRRLRLIALADRVSMPIDSADFDDLVTLVSQAPPWEKDRAAGGETAAEGDRRAEARRARPDARALDMAPRPRGAQGSRPEGEPGVPGREAAARRARQLPRPPPRGERDQADRGRQGRAATCRRRAARLRRGVHAPRDEDDRGRARGARLDRRGGRGARREPAAAEHRADAQAPPPAQQEKAAGEAGATQAGGTQNGSAPGEGAAADGTEQPAAPKKRRRRRRKPGAGAAAARRDGLERSQPPTTQPSGPTSRPSPPHRAGQVRTGAGRRRSRLMRLRAAAARAQPIVSL